MEQLKKELFQILSEAGAKLMGIGSLEGIVEGDMNVGISVMIPLPKSLVEDLKTAPTKEYLDTYILWNERLDQIVEAGAAFLKSKGYQAYANTTKAVPWDETWSTPIPHKTVATRAGLGWIGKNCLLVTKEYGSAMRLSSLITDAPLPINEPINESRCGACQQCVKHCPGQALKGTLWHVGVEREEIFDREICKKTQKERMYNATGIDRDLCGLCFAVCPYTQGYLNRGE